MGVLLTDNGQSFRCEAITWKYLRHDHIVPFIEISDVFDVCLVSAWMPEGSLRRFLRHHPEANRLPHVSFCMNRLLLSLRHV
jgi:serine/threonine protein kinase